MPDLPSSPQRKTMSSVSQAARSQTQKKPGAPKPKGAVRAKSGCYTCRIRRKKCDEQPNGEGACQTCVRLRLQCLGFGAKRPDWMRENNSVTELREKIKSFLASQGMIKGHSGSGPRSTEGEPPVLVLVDNLHSNPSSPPTPTLSASSSEHRPPQNHMESFVRDGSHYAPAMPPPPGQQQYHPPPPPPSWQPHVPEQLGGHPDAVPRGPHGLPPMTSDMLYSNPSNPTNMLSSHSLVPINSSSSSWPNGTSSSSSYVSSSYVSTSTPQYVSSFGQHYYYPYSSDDDPNSPGSVVGPLIPTQVMGSYEYPLIPHDQTEFVDHYLRNVLPIQYLLAPKSISDSMFKLIQTYPTARDAACMLSALHMHCMRLPSGSAQEANQAVTTTYRRLEDTLRNKSDYTEGDAMAGLHVVSTFLFSGGRGSWDLFLDIAVKYVSSVLNNPKYYGPEDVLKKCPESTRFIIKTTMWFDVLASVTTQQIPRFLSVYRQLFGRTGAFIEDGPASPEVSMLPVMGCENHIVLAIAEISDLACWKESQTRRNCLSVPQLVERGIEIERNYLNLDSPFARMSASSTDSIHGLGLNAHRGGGLGSQGAPQPSAADLEIQQRRKLTNEIFRASARVYLHTVLSGDFPACPEIMHGVADTIHALRQVPTDAPSVHRGVIRSVVFGICISGCLTDDRGQRSFLLKMLETQQGETVGNVAEVQALMENVWARREHSQNSGHPVNWREVMRESTRELLLLV